MRGSDFIFDCLHLLYCKCHKINFKPAVSYIGSPDCLKIKATAINPIDNKDNKCFQYPVTVVLNHEEIKKDPQRITKIELFINKFNWKGINYPSEKVDWKKFEKNNLTIALNVLHAKKEKIYPTMFQNIIQIVKNKLSEKDGIILQ